MLLQLCVLQDHRAMPFTGSGLVLLSKASYCRMGAAMGRRWPQFGLSAPLEASRALEREEGCRDGAGMVQYLSSL